MRTSDNELFINACSSFFEDVYNSRPILLNLIPINSAEYDESIDNVLRSVESLQKELLSMRQIDDNKDEIFSITIPHFNLFSKIELKNHFIDFQNEMIESFPDISYEEKQKHPIDIEMETMAGLSEIDSKLQKLEKQRLLYELQQKIYEEKMSSQIQRCKEMYEFFDKPYTTPIDISQFPFLENDYDECYFDDDNDWVPKLDDWDRFEKLREKQEKEKKGSLESLKELQLI